MPASTTPTEPLTFPPNVQPPDAPFSTWSPDSAFWTTDFASTRWLDLLANDAAQADSGFSLAPTPAPREGDERLTQAADIESLHTRLSEVVAAERKSWQADADASLTSHEAGLLRHFAERHLKGVFWIQRSQNVNGASGGLRQAVWWAWLRQDIWAAFREKRPCLSFWVPLEEYHELDEHGLANRAIYLLSQAVNYYVHSRAVGMNPMADPSAPLNLSQVKEKLLRNIGQWKTCLGNQYKPLPTPSSPADVFTRLWIHPPQFGVALQAISFAQILIALHSPALTGFNGYLRMQRTLSEAVDTICGIAIELKEEGCQIMSAQCLYGAGLCVQDRVKQDKILSLIEACESRVGWAPMATWRDDLRREWANADDA
ncbi:hypothetical protein NM208_g300 [Fusarium decemcellulare]|uniref:Uncharacterized protein n=1 Tax=Fusarium decemcellulare TaxID=57161 RepID=A0ACC1T073_9HYPO|nr:hypothetical protein NM208_g300 [Fusarium decemcellulare]